MKRSEMIELIKEHLYNLPQDKPYLWKYINEEADSILNTIEGVGMLPPKSLDTVCVKKGLVRGYTQMFEWEPEDE